MSNTMSPKFCPVCGKPLSTDRQQSKNYCANRNCANFGITVNLRLGETEVALSTNDTAFTINDRRLAVLVDDMRKDAPTNFWRKLEKVSFLQVELLAECMSELGGIEKALRGTPLNLEQRERALSKLNRIACLLEAKAAFASEMNCRASAVVQSDLLLQATEDKLESDRRIYQTITEQEAKNP